MVITVVILAVRAEMANEYVDTYATILAIALAITGLILAGQVSEKEMARNQLAEVDPSRMIEVEGLSCREGVEYYGDGTVRSCVLAREDTLFSHPLPTGTTVCFKPDGAVNYCFLSCDTYVQGVLCKGKGHGFMTTFHRNGRLKTAWLAQDEVIRGIPCARFRLLSGIFGGGDATLFHDNGQLASCTLADTVTIEGRLFDKGTDVRFDSQGKLLLVEGQGD